VRRIAVPRIIVQAVEGRTAEQKRELVKSVTDAVVNAYGCEPKTVTIVIEDIPRENFAKAGVLYTEA
jgi:4-oxalocrotonate tautomerase